MKQINVTKTFLPPQSEYQAILKESWDNSWITNRGALVKRLESKLSEILDSKHLIAMTNGTLPIQIAIKSLGISGEIITTPFSYVATTSSIAWEGCTPIFVDIHPEFLTIDETKIEAAITENTTAILATHVFGNPCEVDKIGQIAKKHNLKVIYDAAHCFGINYHGKSIFNYGDMSTCSFHATKIFHTGEGGALVVQNEEMLGKIFYHHNFGHKGKEDFFGIGINAKMSELQAAMGLAVLPYMDTILAGRKNAVEGYKKQLDWNRLTTMKLREHTKWNYSYFPAIFETEKVLLNVISALNEQKIFPRRYFYPSLNLLPYIEDQPCPISEDIAQRILCLPLYHDITSDEVNRICEIINKQL